MKRSFLISVLLIGLISFSAGAIELTIDYLDGYLDIREDGEWYELTIGEVVLDSDTIRLDEDSIAELSAQGVKLTLTKPGIYNIEDLLEARGKSRSSGIASVIGGKIASILEEPEQTQTAVMGVRGAKSENELDWMSGDTVELLETGKEHLANGDFEEALEVFEEAYDFADISEEAEVLFYLGYTNALTGNLRMALSHLSDADPETDTEYFFDFVLLKGQILTETFAYEEAIEWFGAYEADLEADQTSAQLALLLKGLSYQAIDETTQAKTTLKKAVDINASSEAGLAAQGVLNDL
jgi:tetratricopeptide (TPR) repeat protein